jgi:hypothetical protein
MQLLRAQILEAQKDLQLLDFLFALLGFLRIKATRKLLMKLTPGRDRSCRRPLRV